MLNRKNNNLYRILIYVLLAFFFAFPAILFSQIKSNASSGKKYYKTYNISVKESVRLKIKGSGSSYTWKSSNKKIATVSKKGKVIGKGSGTAVVTAKSKKSRKKTYKFKITVSPSAKMALSDSEIFINKDTAGQYSVLSVSNITANDIVKWEVKNSKVACLYAYNSLSKKYSKCNTATLPSYYKIYVVPVNNGDTEITASVNGYKKVSCKIHVADNKAAAAYYGKTGKNKYGITKDEKKAVDKIVKSISNIIKPDMARIDKVKAVHDYIIQINRYNVEDCNNNTLKPYNFNVVGPMLYNTSVCSGYASTFCVYMYILDIPVKYIYGSVEDTDDHAWNLVQMDDGNWYHIDVTWDDADEYEYGINGMDYNYFLLTDIEMSESRSWNKKMFPAATGTLYEGYYNKLNKELLQIGYSDYLIFESKTDLLAYLVKECGQNKKTDFKVIYYGDTWITNDEYDYVRNTSGMKVYFKTVAKMCSNGYIKYDMTAVYY